MRQETLVPGRERANVVVLALIATSIFMATIVMGGCNEESKNQVVRLETSNKELDDSNKKLLQENNNLQKGRQELLAENNRLGKESRLLQATVSDLRGQVQNLQGQVQDLRQTLSAAAAAAPPPAVQSLPNTSQLPIVADQTAVPSAVVTMPKADQEKVRNAVNWLQKSKICLSCSGSGKIGVSCCKDCAERTSWMETVPQRVKVGEHLVQDGAAQRWVADYETRNVQVRREKGNGKTPIIKLRPSLDLVAGLCLKYPGGVPADILQLAKATCCDIDPGMAASFP